MNQDDLDRLDREWLNIPLSRMERDIGLLTQLLIRSGKYDSRSDIGDALLRVEGQMQQMREVIPVIKKPP